MVFGALVSYSNPTLTKCLLDFDVLYVRTTRNDMIELFLPLGI